MDKHILAMILNLPVSLDWVMDFSCNLNSLMGANMVIDFSISSVFSCCKDRVIISKLFTCQS